MQNRGMEEEGHSYVEHFEFEAECNTLSFSRQTIFRYYIVVTAKLYYIPGCYSKKYIIYQAVTAKLYYISGCYSKIILYIRLLQQKVYYIPGCYSKIILHIRLLQQNYIIYQVVTAKLGT